MHAEMVLQGGILVWLGACAWWDWKKREVYNWLTLPPIVAALLLRIVGQGSGSFQEVLAVVAFLMVAWFAHLAGGADVKVGIALTIYNPMLLVWAWSGAILWYIALRLAKRDVSRFPGVVGFFLGMIVYTAWRFLL